MKKSIPVIARTDDEIEMCFDVMSELRPHLKRETFLETTRQMEDHGFQLAYLKYRGKVVAVAGYRISLNLFLGKHLYVDDLVTAESERSKGYGERLLDWLREEARSAGCNHLHLDSGTQRRDAHRFYFREGLTISSFHFSEELGD